MTDRAPRTPSLDLAEVPQDVRTAIESILENGEVDVVRSGERLGTLAFRAAVLEQVPDGGGVKVVATTMLMSDAARTRLSDAFGPSYVVLDFADAPSTADVLLTHPVSTQLTHRWTLMFPQARIIVTEILDEELGLDVRGPVGRLLDAGADAYLPRRPVEHVAQNVHAYLVSHGRGELGASDEGVIELGPPDDRKQAR